MSATAPAPATAAPHVVMLEATTGLGQPLDKASELRWLEAVRDALPENTYLRDIFAELGPQIREAIRGDLCILDVDLRARAAEYRELTADLNSRRGELAGLAREIAKLQTLREQTAGSLADLASGAEHLARKIRREILPLR